jgi:nucleoside-diphosphate-sugar epimerase
MPGGHAKQTKVFVAGATGALGRRLVPLLVLKGYDVTALTRSAEKAELIRAMGAHPIVADGLDREAMLRALRDARPDVVIHQMTGLTGVKSFRKFDDEFALTTRLRTEGLDYLLEAARAVGARRFIAQSYGNWNYERTGGPVKTEDDPLDPHPPTAMSKTLAAIRHLEAAVTNAANIEGVALRYGNFYGPGAHISEGGAIFEQVRHCKLPVIGNGAGVWSHIHMDDAAAATIAAIDHGKPGIYNIADDEPAAVAIWLPDLAEALGAKPPRHVPLWLGRLVGGEPGVLMFTQIRGASNAKAKRELQWQPAYASWRDGFRRGLANTPVEVSPVAHQLLAR